MIPSGKGKITKCIKQSGAGQHKNNSVIFFYMFCVVFLCIVALHFCFDFFSEREQIKMGGEGSGEGMGRFRRTWREERGYEKYST